MSDFRLHLSSVVHATLLILPLACESTPPIDPTGDTTTASTGGTGGPPPGTTVPSADTSGGTGGTDTPTTGTDSASTGGSSSSSGDPTGDPTESTGMSTESSSGAMEVCPEVIDLGDALPVVEVGDTVAEANDYGPSCFPQCAADAAFSWTAPAAGVYTMDTQGSAYDTGLYVLDGPCGNGPELECNNDVFGEQSALFISLAAGQTVTIIVDGYGLEEGPFQLRIHEGMIYECVDWSGCGPGEYCHNGACWPLGGPGTGTGGWGTSTGGWGSWGGTSGTGGWGTWGSDSGWGGTGGPTGWGTWGGSDSGWGGSGGWGTGGSGGWPPPGTSTGGWGWTSGGWGSGGSGGWGTGWGSGGSGGWGTGGTGGVCNFEGWGSTT